LSVERIEHVQALRERRAAWRRAGHRVALVPTMGNLHAGHLALVQAAAARADRVVATVFVNPLQFGAGEDLGSYPRTLERDAAMLREAGCDLLFAPSEAEVYPKGRSGQTFVEVPALSEELCGASRPGHFRGVATVVAKLFNMVQPDVALFGEKDFQQLLVIRRMTADLDLPVEIVAVPTVREADGLAMSSRNGYLTPAERAIAPELHRTLVAAASRLENGAAIGEVEQAAMGRLESAGFVPDYVSVRCRSDLAHPSQEGSVPPGGALVILAAARLGRARLIDNIACDVETPLA
jgi:pantoate--beta-alanine ligase